MTVNIDNVPKFMMWLNDSKFQVKDPSHVDYDWIVEKSDKYRREARRR